MVRFMDSIDVHNTIDTMKFSSFVYDYMYDDDFCDVCDEAHIGPSDFLEQKIGEALDPIRSLELDDYSKDYSHMVTAKDNLSMLLIDYYQASTLDVDYYRLMQDSAMFHDWQRRLDESSRKVLNLQSEPEDESEKEF